MDQAGAEVRASDEGSGYEHEVGPTVEKRTDTNKATNLTSTPATAVSSYHTSRPVDYQESIRISTGGISDIIHPRLLAEPTSRASYPPRSARSSRDLSYGYPLSQLTEGGRTFNLTTHGISQIVARRHGLTLTCHKVRLKRKIQYGLRERLRRCRDADNEPHDNVVIHGMSGYFPPGLNAIMGSSGCGKTSLLSVLSLRNKKFEGAIRLNGNPAPENFSKLCGFSIQDDILKPGLTVRQHLWFSLCLRRGGMLDEQEKHALVNDILKSLRLEHCGDEKVGEISSSRISGGERKRTGIGMELVAAPKIIFLDEPTSSLDSTTSKYILRILRDLADNGRTIILSIHQPSSYLYRMFDRLTLMAKGRLIYHGPASQALNYFTSLGFPHEPHYTPPDFFLDILYGKVTSNRRRRSVRSTPHPRRSNSVQRADFSPTYWTTVGEGLRQAAPHPERGNPAVPIIRIIGDSQDSSTINNNIELASPKDRPVFIHRNPFSSSYQSCFLGVNDECEAYSSKLDGTTVEGMREHSEIACWLAEEYANSYLGRETEFRLHELQNRSSIGDQLELEISSRDALAGQPSFLIEFLLLSRRSIQVASRLCGTLILMNIFIGLLFGMFYYQSSGKQPVSVQNKEGMFFYLSIYGIVVHSIVATKNFAASERALFEHEKRGGHYRTISYCFSCFTILAVARLLSAVVLSSIVYWMSGLKTDGGTFLLFTLTMFTSGLAGDTLCLACVLGFKSFAVGKSVVILYKSLTAVFAGFLVNLDSTFSWLAWIKYISITRYCFVAWVVGEFSASCSEDSRHSNETTHIGSPSKCQVNELEQSVLIETVGNDEYMVEHIWVNHVILLIMTLLFLFVCYFHMRKIR